MALGGPYAWGISNFVVMGMEELTVLPEGDAVTTEQVLYKLARWGIKYTRSIIRRRRVWRTPGLNILSLLSGKCLPRLTFCDFDEAM